MTKSEKFLRDLRKVCSAYGFWLQGAEVLEEKYPYKKCFESVTLNSPEIDDGVEYRKSHAYDVQSAEWLFKRERIEEE